MNLTIKSSSTRPLNHDHRVKPPSLWLEPENQRYNLNQNRPSKQSPQPKSRTIRIRATSGAGNIDTNDIMRYIQNAEETEKDVDLFSWMLMRKCLLALLMLMLVVLMLILMLLNLNTGYADINADYVLVLYQFFQCFDFIKIVLQQCVVC